MTTSSLTLRTRTHTGATTKGSRLTPQEADDDLIYLDYGAYAAPERYGAAGDGVTDDNSALQALLNRGGRVVLKGGKTYMNAAANLTFIANTELVIEEGAALHLSTTRLSAINVDNVQIHLYGEIRSTALNTTDSTPSGWQGRGIVEFGGTVASPISRVGISGTGRVYGDFSGTPGTTSISVGDKRRGILFNNVQGGWCRGIEVDHTIAEAVWVDFDASGSSRDISFEQNRIHDCNHDAMSGAGFGSGGNTFRTRGNIAWNCLNGIECQYGDHQHNVMKDMIGSGYCFGGNAPSDNIQPTIYANNTGINNGNSGSGSTDFDLQGDTIPGGIVIVENNTSVNSGRFGFLVTWAKTAVITGNKAYGWGQTNTGSGICTANCTTVIADGNQILAEGANSNGGYNLNATTLISGNNIAAGVANPYVAGNPGLYAGTTKVLAWTTAGATVTGTLGVTSTVTLNDYLHVTKSSAAGKFSGVFINNGATSTTGNAAALIFGASNSFNTTTYAAQVMAVMTNVTTQACDLTFEVYNGSADIEVARFSTGIFQTVSKLWPGTEGNAYQSTTGICAGSGAPNNANGANGDFYFRADGFVSTDTVVYHKEGGSWVALTLA